MSGSEIMEELEKQKIAIEKEKLNIESQRLEFEKYKLEYESFKDGFNSCIQFANTALKSLLILNGGACLAILTTIGSMFSKSDRNFAGVSNSIADPLIFFGWGAFLAVSSAATSYVAQHHFCRTIESDGKIVTHNSKFEKLGSYYQGLAVFSAAISLGLFLLGLYSAVEVFESIP